MINEGKPGAKVKISVNASLVYFFLKIVESEEEIVIARPKRKKKPEKVSRIV
jgi:DNA-binding cell septation regulator SpoVG